MKWNDYMEKFNEILTSKFNDPPYDSKEYFEFVKLNWSRVKRWNKTGVLLKDTIDSFQGIRDMQNWILITDIQLRDSGNLIDQYMTNGTRSIPILIVRDDEGNDLYVWGPRPKACQIMATKVKKSGGSSPEIKKAVQLWYNEDRGVSIQNELIAMNENIKDKMVECH